MNYPKWKKEQEELGYIVNGLTVTKKETPVIIKDEVTVEAEIVEIKEVITEVIKETEIKDIDTTEPIIDTSDNSYKITEKSKIDLMTKKEFETYARDTYEIELDLRETKKNMIEDFNSKNTPKG